MQIKVTSHPLKIKSVLIILVMERFCSVIVVLLLKQSLKHTYPPPICILLMLLKLQKQTNTQLEPAARVILPDSTTSEANVT